MQKGKSCVDRAREKGLSRQEAVHALITEHVRAGKIIEGMGHRYHTKDPRRDALWNLATKYRVAGECVKFSRIVTEEFEKVRGMRIPINVDGVIGAIVADMGLHKDIAKALFVIGRVLGLSAHYFEETSLYPPMRRIDFKQAFYKGKESRKFPRNRE